MSGGSRIVGEAMWAFNGSEDSEGGSPEWTTLEEGLKSVLEKLWSRRDLIAQYNGAHRLRDGRFRFTAELTSDLLPKEATGKQVTDLVVGYLRDHPDARQYVVAQEVTLALVKAFPCKK
jgi:Rap1a immunity proteins